MASAREGGPDTSRTTVLSDGRILATVFAHLSPADVAKTARTCRTFAATAKRSAVWASRPIVADALSAAASGAPDARVSSCRLSGLGAAGAASAIVGVQGAWETAGGIASASGGARVPQFQAPAMRLGDSPVGEAVAALDLFPGDAPWLHAALASASAATAADMVLGGFAAGTGLPTLGGAAAHMVWCAAAVTVRPGVLVLAAPSGASGGAGDTWPAKRAYLPLTSASRRPITVAAVSHRHVVFSSADGSAKPSSAGPFVSVVDLHRVDPAAFLSAAPSSDAISASLGESGIRAHKTITLTPPSLARRQAADAPAASPLIGSAVSALALLQAGAASASERCPALAAVGTYGRGPEGNAVFVLDLEAGTSLCAMWGHSKGINCLSIGHLPTAERRWSAWREARGDRDVDGRASDMRAALGSSSTAVAAPTVSTGAGDTSGGSKALSRLRAAAAAWVTREMHQLSAMAPADAREAVTAAVQPPGTAAGAGHAGAADDGAAAAAEADAMLKAVDEARAEADAAAGAAGAGPGDAPRRAAGEYGPRGYTLERPEGGPVGAQPVLPVPAPHCPGAHIMQRDAATCLRGVVVASGDRAGRIMTWDCAGCEPLSALQATSGQVTAITLDAMTGHAVATAWPSGTATELNVLTGQTVRCLGREQVMMAAVDWEAGVAAVRSTPTDEAPAGEPRPAIRYTVRSLWHPPLAHGLPQGRPLFTMALADKGRSGSPQVAIRGDTMAFVHPGEGGRAEPTLRIVTVGATLADAKRAGAAGGDAGACAVM